MRNEDLNRELLRERQKRTQAFADASVASAKAATESAAVAAKASVTRTGITMSVLLFLGIFALLAVVIVAVAHILSQPVEFEMDCSGSVDGNLQWDGAPLRVVGNYDATGKMLEVPIAMNPDWPDLKAWAPPTVNIPSFTQARVNGVSLQCKMKGSGPMAFILQELEKQ